MLMSAAFPADATLESKPERHFEKCCGALRTDLTSLYEKPSIVVTEQTSRDSSSSLFHARGLGAMLREPTYLWF